MSSGTRHRLIDCAVELLGEFGYAGMSVNEVARRVGIRKPSIFHHFKDKRSLAAAASERVIERYWWAIEPLLKIDQPSWSQLESVMDRVVELAVENRNIGRVAMRLFVENNDLPFGPSLDPEEPIGRLLSTTIHWLEAASAAGVIRPIDSPVTLLHLIGTLVFYPSVAYDTGLTVLEGDPWEPSALDRWRTELRLFLRGALAPTNC